MATCYRHSDRETGVSCSNCGRPICPDCMTPTSVGMRCPECAKQKTKVRTARTMHDDPRVTVAIIIVCVIAFLAAGSYGPGSGGNEVYNKGALVGLYFHEGDWWRIVTAGFLHQGFLHILLNLYLLWWLGQQLEPAMGSARFGVLYGTALLFGSFGAIVESTTVGVVGASGAVFGVMGATAVEQRRRGYDPFGGGIGVLLLFNLAFTFLWPNIAIGGHIGGLVGGVLAALAFHLGDRLRQPWVGYAGCALLAIVAVAGAYAMSGDIHNYSF